MKILVVCLIFVILSFIASIVIHKKKIYVTKRKKIILIISMVLLFAFSLIPFEGVRIEFDSPEQALHYLAYNEKIEEKIMLPEGAFLICSIGYGDSSMIIHSIEKHAEKWSAIGINEAQELINTGFFDSVYGNSISKKLNLLGTFTYNKNFNKTLLEISGNFNADNDINIKNINGDEFILYSSKTDSQGNRVLKAYIILDGAIPTEMDIFINDEIVKIK